MAFNFGVNVLPTSNESLSLGSSDLRWNLYGNLTGNATTATSLATAREIYVNLGSVRNVNSKITFDGSADIVIDIDGTLGIAHGGTGVQQFTINSIVMSGSTTTAPLTTRAVVNNTGPTALSSASTSIPTVNTVLNALTNINGAKQKSDENLWGPISALPASPITGSIYVVKSMGSGSAPDWVAVDPSLTLTAGNTTDAPKIKTTVAGQASSDISLTKASTSAYGVTKLISTSSTTEKTLAATPKGVWAAIMASNVKIGTQTVHPSGANDTDTFNVNKLVEDLGLNRAFQYRGVVSVKPTSSAGPNSESNYYSAGDVVIVDGAADSSDDGVYTFDGTVWTKLGANTSAYKLLQDAVSDPSLTSGTVTSFISSITQDINGVISPIKKAISDATTSTKGIIQIGDGLNVSSGVASVAFGTSISSLGVTNDVGSSTAVARADHVHAYPTASQVGASVIPITADMGTISNSGGSTADTITISKTVVGVTSDMTVDRVIVGTPTAFLSDITVTTGTDSVGISATIAAGASSTISVKLSNNRDVTGV